MRAKPQAVLLSVRMAFYRWRMRVKTKASDLENGGGFLLDPRFADGILVFATSSQQATCLLDELVVALASVGVGMNENKRKLLRHKPNQWSMVNGQCL